jgi:hypothetical protein
VSDDTGGVSVAENPIRAVPEEGCEPNANINEPNSGSTVNPRSRLERRMKALKRRQRQIVVPNTPVKLLTTDELRRALALTERAEVLPNGDVRCPEIFHAAPQEEWAILERWSVLCGEPLNHIEAAEELLDRMGEANGWRSREAGEAALLLARLTLLGASHRLIGEMAHAIINLYAELEEHHPGGWGPKTPHLHVRDAIRHITRLEGVGRFAYESSTVPEERDNDLSRAATAYGEMFDTTHRSGSVNESLETSEGPNKRASYSDLLMMPGGARKSARNPWWRKLYIRTQWILSSRAHDRRPEGTHTRTPPRLARSFGWFSRVGS